MEALKIQPAKTSVIDEAVDVEWLKAKTQLMRLTGDFQMVLDNSDPTTIKPSRKGKDLAVTVRIADIMDNPCYLQVIEKDRQKHIARYILYQNNGTKACIRDLLTVV